MQTDKTSYSQISSSRNKAKLLWSDRVAI